MQGLPLHIPCSCCPFSRHPVHTDLALFAKWEAAALPLLTLMKLLLLRAPTPCTHCSPPGFALYIYRSIHNRKLQRMWKLEPALSYGDAHLG